MNLTILFLTIVGKRIVFGLENSGIMKSMLFGHEHLEKQFKRLVKEGTLSHGYIFYGDAQVGKYSFAKSLANYIEKGEFEMPKHILSEAFFIEPLVDEESKAKSIGIDAVRDLQHFLYQKPSISKYRVAIINDAHFMTDIAEHAILKIAEEPPEHALIIMIVPNVDSLLKTVQSRFQKIYFGGVAKEEIKNFLISEHKIGSIKAGEMAEVSFGRVGRAIDLLQNEVAIEIRREALDFLTHRPKPKEIASELAEIENRDRIEPFLSEIIAELSKDMIKNYLMLKLISHRFTMIKEFNVNKRLQLESALTGIVSK